MGGTVGKSLALLDCLAAVQDDIGLSELARALNFDKATTLRLLTPMVTHGMVEKLAHSRRYRLGPMVLRLARKREATVTFPQSAGPILKSLSAAVQESCHLTEPAEMEMISSIVVNSDRAIRVQLVAGQRIPLHCTASGLAYLAFGPRAVLDRVLAAPLPALTPNTCTTPEAVLREVSATMARGYAFNCGAFDIETCSVAAPILDGTGLAKGALSIAAPTTRIDEHGLQRLADSVVAAAHEITRTIFGSLSHSSHSSRSSR